VLLGLLLIPLNAYWQVQSEFILYLAHPTGFALFFNVVYILFGLACVNAVLRALCPRHAFRQGELITIYVMLCQSTALAGHSFMQILAPTLAAPLAWATPENDWHNLFIHLIPSWLMVSDPDVVAGYAGAGKDVSSFFNGPTVLAWLIPMAVWSAFVSVLVFVMVCINVILRKRWTDEEKLTYPIVQLPYEMARPSLGLFRNPLFWTSFTLVGILDVINGLHVFYPAVPSLRVPIIGIGGSLFRNPPWDAFGVLMVTFRPFLMGIILLIPLEISFSCWALIFLWKAQRILARLIGGTGAVPRATDNYPEQTVGMYIGLAIIAVWCGRRHFARAIASLWNSARDQGRDAQEPMSYRAAAIGLLAGFALLTGFSLTAGMSLWVAVGFLVLYLATVTGVTRVRAEVGSPVHGLHWAGPEELIVDAVGTRTVGPRSLMVCAFYWFLSRAHYSDVMPHQLEGLRMASRARMNQRHVLSALLIASVVGIVVGLVALVEAGYRSQTMSGFGTETLTRLQRWLTNPVPPDPIGVALFASGILLVIGVTVLRTKFIWWPFHPVGFAVSVSGWWFMFMIAWVVKLAILKQGGVTGLRKATPFFMGMILGEFVVGGSWALLGVVMQVRTFSLTAWW
jgi:hypothetical protein